MKNNSSKELITNELTINKIHTFLVAMGLSTNLLAYTLGEFQYNVIIILLIITMLLLMLPTIRVSGLDLIFFGCTSILLVVSIIKFDFEMTVTYTGFFGLFSLFSFLGVTNRLNEYFLIKYLTIILFLCSPLAIYATFYITDEGYNLGISYNFLLGFLTTIYLFFLQSRKNSKKFNLILLFNLLVYTSFFLIKGNRGTILIILLFLVIYWLMNTRNTIKGTIVKLTIISIIVVVSSNLVQIFAFLDKILNKLNTNILAINKTLELLQHNNSLDSGRVFIINRLFQSIVSSDSLWLGKGVGYIESILNTYSHNIFFQYLFEGGIWYVSIFLVLIVVLIKNIIVISDYFKKSLLIIFLCSIILQLFLSNVHWINPGYWFIAHYVFTLKFSYKNRDKLGVLNE